MSGILEAFILGTLATASAVIALYFLKFWRNTRDGLFLAFAAAFAVECVLRVVRAAYISSAQPYEGTALRYAIRLIASLLILVAILRKNYSKKGKA